jgi:signal peptidase
MSIKKVARKAIDVLFSLVIIVLLFALVTSYLGFQTYVVRSGSMEPEIHTASVAIVNENVNFYDIRVGDVVAFKLQTGELVTHRVIEISKIDGITHFLTKGDNNDAADGYTTNIQNYYGKTIYSIPNLGYFMDWVMSAQGRIVTIGSGLALILIYMMLDDEKKIYMLLRHVQDTEDMQPGDVRHFTFSLQTDNPAENVVFTEVVPVGMTFVEGSARVNGEIDENAAFNIEQGVLMFSAVDIKDDEIMLEFDLMVPAPEEIAEEDVAEEEGGMPTLEEDPTPMDIEPVEPIEEITKEPIEEMVEDTREAIPEA